MQIIILLDLSVIWSLAFAKTAWKVSKYGVFSGSYFSVFSPNKGKYGPEKF